LKMAWEGGGQNKKKKTQKRKKIANTIPVFLISSFPHVLYVVYFLLGNYS